MLSRNLKRVLLDSRWSLPPTFLLPWAANLSTTSHAIDPVNNLPPPPPPQPNTRTKHIKITARAPSAQTALNTSRIDGSAIPSPNPQRAPLLSPSIRELLPFLKAQGSHYITLHIHGKPYLVTQGDTIRLPFFMHGVEPGDVLRMNRAINLGSRDYTMKASAAPPKLRSKTMRSIEVIDPTTGSAVSTSRIMPSTSSIETTTAAAEVVAAAQPGVASAPHFIPHIEKGKHSYLDERLFVCRAVVMGVESEPLRIMEKTKRRNRKIKKVKSKMRFTVLKIKEVKVKGMEELEEMEEV